MTENAARAKRWMLRAAPIMALAGAFFGVGGAAAGLALWMALGLLLSNAKGHILLYPKQRRMTVHRLLLGYAFCVCILGIMHATGQWLLRGNLTALSSYLLLLGGIGFSLPLGAWAIQWRLKRPLSLLLSVLFYTVSLFLILSG